MLRGMAKEQEKERKKIYLSGRNRDSVALVPKFHSCLPDDECSSSLSGAVEPDQPGLKSKSLSLPAV